MKSMGYTISDGAIPAGSVKLCEFPLSQFVELTYRQTGVGRVLEPYMRSCAENFIHTNPQVRDIIVVLEKTPNYLPIEKEMGGLPKLTIGIYGQEETLIDRFKIRSLNPQLSPI